MQRSATLSTLWTIAVLCVVLAIARTTNALSNGLSVTPQMGWNTWNYHGCNISEDIILTAARQLKASGLQNKGYEYVWIDDCWQADERDPTTKEIPANPEKFPSGLKSVTDQIHAMGLKAGIYSSAGVMTCGHKIGSLGYEDVDAKSWANAGFDALKYDNCFNQGQSGTPLVSFERYNKMSMAINNTGRPIVLSLCQWGEDQVWSWATETWNSWRISGDIADTFNREDDRCPCTDSLNCKLAGYHCSVENILNKAAPLGQRASTGGWNDLDMLEVGNGGMTRDEEVTHFSMWAMVKSPLIMGNDLSVLTNQTRAIVGNEDVIAINQDPMGTPAVRLWNRDMVNGKGTHQIWLAPLVNMTFALAIVNFGEGSYSVTPSLADIFIDYTTPEYLSNEWNLFDLWAGVNFDNPDADKNATRIEGSPFSNALGNITVAPHATRLFRMVPTNATSSSATSKRDDVAPLYRQIRSIRGAQLMANGGLVRDLAMDSVLA